MIIRISKYLFSIAFVLALLFGNRAIAGVGPDSSAWNIGFNTGIGYIMAHHPNMVLLQQDHVKSFEITFERNTNGSKDWHKLYHYPKLGYSYQFYNLGAPELLGNAHALDVYLKVGILNKPKYNLFIKPLFGLGYIDKVYDRIENPKNVSINGHINALVQLQAGVEAKLTSNIDFNSSLHFTHFSNGAISKPNQGINMPSFNLGLSYGIGKNNFAPEVAAPTGQLESYVWVSGAATVKQLYPAGGDFYWAYILTAGKYYKANHIIDYGYGLDFTYDNSLIELRKREEMDSNNFVYGTRGGAHIGMIVNVGRVGAVVNAGAYAFNHSPKKQIMYSKLGVRVELNKNLFTGVNLKTHYARADLLEWNIGWKFNKYEAK
ncbi:MAG: acyloxyacyl hydrolase [Bacteroidia bacterium]|nr:acyloxyacyl hydrolase [Bacteroidia bacterium]